MTHTLMKDNMTTIDLPNKIKNCKAVVSVLGLPLAVVLARSGLRVIGVDVDEHRVAMIRKGQMPFYYPEIETWLKTELSRRMFTVSTDSKRSIELSDVIVITVGTPTGVQHQLDYSQFHAAFDEIKKADIRNKAIIIRSTSVPRTMTDIVLPILTGKSGLELGINLAVAVCPERILEGQAHRELYELPEIVGGLDDLSVRIASELFKKINPNKKTLVTTPTGAELAKLFTNIHRYVNFALANEFAIWAEKNGEDAHDIIRIANEDYPRSRIPQVGFAGGPCLGKDGFLLDNSTTFSSIISVAWKLNEAIPQHIVMSLMDELGSLCRKKIAVLGITFKANSNDLRMSPSVKMVEILKAYGAEVMIHDPHVQDTLPLNEVLKNPEVVVLATNHSAFKNLASTIDSSGCKIIYDVWGIFRPNDFVKSQYRRLGRGR